MKKIAILTACLALAMALVGCTSAPKDQSADSTQSIALIDQAPTPSASNLGGSASVEAVAAALEQTGLSNTSTFKEFAQDFADVAGSNANLADDFVDPDRLAPDLTACMNGWEAAHTFSDADCRMTAMLLLSDVVTSKADLPTYTGTYLMFDLDAIQNVERYAPLKEHEALFTTLFGEMPVQGDNVEDALPAWWKQHGISITNKNVSLISVGIYDPNDNVVFIGHTGVLVQYDDYVLFVEKLAFEQPYRVTKAADANEIITMLAARPEYQPGESVGERTIIYINDEPVVTI